MTIHLIIIDTILFISLIISVITDLKTRKILDIVTYPTVILGITFNTIFLGMDGLRFSLIGWLTGIMVFWVLHVTTGMGLGDVKLMGAVGALKGWYFTVNTLIYIGLAGGLMAIIYLIVTGKFVKILVGMFDNLLKKSKDGKEPERTYLPYGPAILLGVLFYYIALKLNYSIIAY